MPIFKALKTNLPPAFMEAARKLPVQAAGKVGWQAPRFWETNDRIYGGISWTTDPITQIWYPSHDYLSAKGVLTGAYMYGASADEFNARPVAERLRIAKDQGERIHDGYSKYVEHGVAIGWDNMEFSRFAWADETSPEYDAPAKVLSTPQGRFHMAGDQLTYWSGWQEGARAQRLAGGPRDRPADKSNGAARLARFQRRFRGLEQCILKVIAAPERRLKPYSSGDIRVITEIHRSFPSPW